MKIILKIYLPISVDKFGELGAALGEIFPGCKFAESDDESAVYVIAGEDDD